MIPAVGRKGYWSDRGQDCKCLCQVPERDAMSATSGTETDCPTCCTWQGRNYSLLALSARATLAFLLFLQNAKPISISGHLSLFFPLPRTPSFTTHRTLSHLWGLYSYVPCWDRLGPLPLSTLFHHFSFQTLGAAHP